MEGKAAQNTSSSVGGSDGGGSKKKRGEFKKTKHTKFKPLSQATGRKKNNVKGGKKIQL